MIFIAYSKIHVMIFFVLVFYQFYWKEKKRKIAFSHVWSNVFNLNEVFSLHCLRFPGFTLFQLWVFTEGPRYSLPRQTIVYPNTNICNAILTVRCCGDQLLIEFKLIQRARTVKFPFFSLNSGLRNRPIRRLLGLLVIDQFCSRWLLDFLIVSQVSLLFFFYLQGFSCFGCEDFLLAMIRINI